MPEWILEHPRVRKFLELCNRDPGYAPASGPAFGRDGGVPGAVEFVVPLEPASMPGRVVVQWDKEDCADLGLVKMDLLGLGMMAALEDTWC